MIKIVELNKKSINKIENGNIDFFEKDFENLSKSYFPGEWVYLKNDNKVYIGYINLFVEKGPVCRVIGKMELSQVLQEQDLAKKIIKERIQDAFNYRELFKCYTTGYRLVYGGNDLLPGLIVDVYVNDIIIQINTAGVDRFREYIKEIISNLYPNKKCYFLDNIKYRSNEILPTYEVDELPEILSIEENGIKYSLSKSILQKIGYYYDHRDNRKKLLDKLNDLDFTFKRGLDLFCYVGSWGLHLLKGNVEKVVFVDQGNMNDTILNNLELNQYEKRGEFHRSDVFKFLDLKNKNNEKFDIIVSDPPAFSKSGANKQKAISGYRKLHTKILSLLSDKAFFIAASCTHNVSLDDIDKTVQDAAFVNDKNIRMIDIGIQGSDHPFSSFSSNGHYLKYILYYVEKK